MNDPGHAHADPNLREIAAAEREIRSVERDPAPFDRPERVNGGDACAGERRGHERITKGTGARHRLGPTAYESSSSTFQ